MEKDFIRLFDNIWIPNFRSNLHKSKNVIEKVRSTFLFVTFHNNQHGICLDKELVEKIFCKLLKTRNLELKNFLITEERSTREGRHFHVCLFLNRNIDTRNGYYFNFFMGDVNKEFVTSFSFKKHFSEEDSTVVLTTSTGLRLTREKLYALIYSMKEDYNPHSNFSLEDLQRMLNLIHLTNTKLSYGISNLKLYVDLNKKLELFKEDLTTTISSGKVLVNVEDVTENIIEVLKSFCGANNIFLITENTMAWEKLNCDSLGIIDIGDKELIIDKVLSLLTHNSKIKIFLFLLNLKKPNLVEFMTDELLSMFKEISVSEKVLAKGGITIITNPTFSNFNNTTNITNISSESSSVKLLKEITILQEKNNYLEEKNNYLEEKMLVLGQELLVLKESLSPKKGYFSASFEELGTLPYQN